MPDAVQELITVYGIDPEHKKLLEEAEAKKQRRSRRGRPSAAAGAGAQDKMKTRGSSIHPSGVEMRSMAATKPTQPSAERKRPLAAADSNADNKKSAKKSRVDTINENHPAKVPENQPIANAFVELGEYELTRGDVQRGISRMKAAKEIRNTDQQLTSGSQARALPGVGPSAAAKVDEVLDHGTIDKLEEAGTAMLKEGAQEEQAEMIHEVEDAEAEDEQEAEGEADDDDDDEDYIDHDTGDEGDDGELYDDDDDENAI